MSISKKIIFSLSLLAFIGGISIAVISVSANGKLINSQAFTFIQNSDLSGYKTFMINEETARIQNIDQAQFDKIKAKYEKAKPLMELQTKYEALLTPFATSKDQASYVSTFKQYIKEAESLPTKPKSKKILSENDINKAAMKSYDKAVKDLSEGRKVNIAEFGKNRDGKENR
jgi:hypothetical protein